MATEKKGEKSTKTLEIKSGLPCEATQSECHMPEMPFVGGDEFHGGIAWRIICLRWRGSLCGALPRGC